jgi:hypothetical protein
VHIPSIIYSTVNDIVFYVLSPPAIAQGLQDFDQFRNHTKMAIAVRKLANQFPLDDLNDPSHLNPPRPEANPPKRFVLHISNNSDDDFSPSSSYASGPEPSLGSKMRSILPLASKRFKRMVQTPIHPLIPGPVACMAE